MITMTSKFKGRCASCESSFSAGAQIRWEKGRGAFCLDCEPLPAVETPLASPPRVRAPAAPFPVSVAPRCPACLAWLASASTVCACKRPVRVTVAPAAPAPTAQWVIRPQPPVPLTGPRSVASGEAFLERATPAPLPTPAPTPDRATATPQRSPDRAPRGPRPTLGSDF